MKIWDVCISILTIVASSYAAFHFGMRGKRREIDLSKNKELNVVLSNLLLVWEYLTALENLLKIMKQPHEKSIIPLKYYPAIIKNMGKLNELCFTEFEASVALLKQYDPVIYFEIQGFGRSSDDFLKKFINPVLFSSEIDSSMVVATVEMPLIDIIERCEDLLELVAKLQSSQILADVRDFISSHRERDFEAILESSNNDYFQYFLRCFPDFAEMNPTIDDFIEFARSEEYKEVVDVQMFILVHGLMQEYIDLFQLNPEISPSEMLECLKKIAVNKK